MKGTAKQLSVLFGLVVGYVVAICMGKVDFSGFQELSVVSLPQFMPFKPEFDWARSSPSDCCTWSRPSRFWETPPR